MDRAVEGRLARLRSKLAEKRLDVVLVTNMDNVRYLTGFTGSTATAIVSKSDAVLLVDSRYTLQASEQCRRFQVREYKDSVLPAAACVVKEMKTRRLAFEADHMSYADHRKLRTLLSVRYYGALRFVDDLRLVKDSQEVAAIRQAVAISDKCFEDVIGRIKPGMSERELAIDMDFCMRRHGADKPAFDTIVAAGPHAAFPHAQPSDRILEAGQLVKMDFGAEYGQYPSDLTRTVCLGKADAKQREVYNTVLQAQLKAIDVVRPGAAGKDVDAVARDHIAAAGYGEYFGHGLGHSLGRGVHDGPGFSRTSTIILEPGMVMTVEPGIYIPDWGGVRIEDDVLVTESGCEILTGATKELLEL
ncbi:MAG: Xaa-Pro peptidase family protein [Armatimonadota bacterium]|nr:Xaa-Pro peptidase family protein [Armatimonadota bacterium]